MNSMTPTASPMFPKGVLDGLDAHDTWLGMQGEDKNHEPNLGLSQKSHSSKKSQGIGEGPESSEIDMFASKFPAIGHLYQAQRGNVPDGQANADFYAHDGADGKVDAAEIQQTCIRQQASNAVVPSSLPVALSPYHIPVVTTPLPGLRFANHQQSIQAFSSRRVPHNWQAPVNDPTLPCTQQARETYIKQMRTAFLDVTQFQDSTKHRGVGDRWTRIARGHVAGALNKVEIVCWKLLTMAEALHIQGPASLNILDSGKLKKVYTSRKSLFKERIDDMCDLMRTSKARCDILLAMDDLQMFVGAPRQMSNLSKQMRRNNANRQLQLEAGREILKNTQAALTGQLMNECIQNQLRGVLVDQEDQLQVRQHLSMPVLPGSTHSTMPLPVSLVQEGISHDPSELPQNNGVFHTFGLTNIRSANAFETQPYNLAHSAILIQEQSFSSTSHNARKRPADNESDEDEPSQKRPRKKY